ncbi:hypothetical protein [Kitasatospora atroaurantiaca]|uniref:Secreted protein n=1 Tax=Kitasatospora atroaurantiaca TaxID=285545 RepID=A0A561EQU2_9ACTN|nr:hypothetical protein [Kitasatospora atroaurantiaca]TWE17982.1 hypothetical protein FB465_3029 [Kitasatospora atroaurantiaca]
MLRKTSGAGLLTALGAAMLLGATAPAASAESGTGDTSLPQPSTHLQSTDVGPALGGVTGALGYSVTPVKTLRLDPFAQSSADVLNNGVAVEPDNGLKPVTTGMLTAPLSNGGGVKDLPHVGPLLGVLPG